MKLIFLTTIVLFSSLFVLAQNASDSELDRSSNQSEKSKKVVVLPPVELIPINPNATAKDLERLKSQKKQVAKSDISTEQIQTNQKSKEPSELNQNYNSYKKTN